jgi:IPT/TIG domain
VSSMVSGENRLFIFVSLRWLWGMILLLLLLSLVACGGGSTSTGGGGGGGGGGGSSGGSPPPNYPGNRTGFVRTDDTPNSAVYDPVHKLVFASEPDLGIVDAISIANQQIEAKIFVPGVNALGITPDDAKVLASTSMQQVAWIDTSLLQVIQWQILPKVNDPVAGEQYFAPTNYFAPFGSEPTYPGASYNPAILANGKVLFEVLEGGFSSTLVEWDPVANTAVLLTGGPSGGPVSTSANGSEVFFAAGPAIFDSATNQFRTSNAFSYIALAAANPTGTQFALGTADSITFIDAQFNVLGKVSGGANGIAYSSDGKYVYITTGGSITGLTGPGLTTIDALKYSVLGAAPDYYDANGAETPLSADDTGFVFGSATGGLVLSDATNFQTLSTPPGASISPSEGPTQGGTSTTVAVSIPGQLPDVWFGSQLATSESLTASGVLATSPAADSVGAVNVKLVEPNGAMDVIPQAFTYGAVPLNPAPLAAALRGGAAADIIGFGFGADISGASTQVTIGGASARIVSSTQADGIPRQDLTVTVPSGSPGAVDIVVTSPSGTGTLSKGFHYLNSVTDYATKDALQSILYDQQRQQLYLNAGDHIDVFSLSQKTYSAPIIPPSLGGTRQLTAMALTPDSSKLLVGNFSDNSLAIINPDNPATATAVQIFPAAAQGHYQLAPCSIAATSKNTVFVDGGTSSATGGGGSLYELDLGTLQVTQRTDPGLGFLQVGGNLLAASQDGTQVYMAAPNDSGGYVMGWSAATDTWQFHNLGGAVFLFYVDGVASRDGNVFAMSMDIDASDFVFPMIVDAGLNQISQLGIESTFAAENLQGNALHDSGSLLYSSTNYGVDLIDVKHGALAERILLSEQDVFLDGSLAVDETGQKIFLITNAGLTDIELDSVPLSVGSITPSVGSTGTLAKIRGSGFNAGTNVKFNGATAATTLIDEDTLQVSVPPSTQTGGAQIVVSNSDGSSYTLDSAFTVQ